jgi:NAD(P)-dependent dehydrogenase (short-subunit alcohol dehydrogenase family)
LGVKLNRLQDKVAIITGAGSGIGRATAVLFAREGAKVVVADLDPEGGQETVRLIKESNGEAFFAQADVSKASDVKKMVGLAVSTYGKLDIMFNNAGIPDPDSVPITHIKEENWDKVIAVNLKGVFLGMKYAIPEMVKIGGGAIINTASCAGIQPVRGVSSYNASKAGVINLTKSAALEYVRKNIRINCISPGPCESNLNPPSVSEALEKQSTSGRLAKAEEIAWVALFLVSDESSHITATGISVDGGWTASGGPVLTEIPS